jgi:hypothetical protein
LLCFGFTVFRSSVFLVWLGFVYLVVVNRFRKSQQHLLGFAEAPVWLLVLVGVAVSEVAAATSRS